jgi:AraC family transcriptional regulator, glycine betaine-responsive activator
MTVGLPGTFGFLLFPDFPMACLSAAIEPLRAANEISGKKVFHWQLIAEREGPIMSSAGVQFSPDITLENCKNIETIFILSMPNAQFENQKSGYARLRWLDRVGVTLGGFSGGVFPLARSGVMQGHQSSVHWCYEAAFKSEFPNITVIDTLVMFENRRITASGSGAVFDVMLSQISTYLGNDIMAEVACWFQHPLVRDCGVAQKVPVRHIASTKDSLPKAIRDAISLFESHIEDPIRIADAAAIVGLSERHFERMFKLETGHSPLRFYRNLRLEKVRQRVLHTSDSLTEIAVSTGFEKSGLMTKYYAQEFGLKPREERKNMSTFRQMSVNRQAVS